MSYSGSTRSAWLALALAGLFTATPVQAQQITYDTRALTGTDGPLGPGLGSGVHFIGYADPILNSAGATAFLAGLTGTGVDGTNNTGIWSEGGGPLTLVARKGSAAPGTGPGVNYSNFAEPVLNGAGATAFFGILSGTGVNGTNNNGIWSAGGGPLALVARKGNAAPGTGPGVNFNGFSSPVLNGAGATAFSGFLTGTGVDGTNDFGIWSAGGGPLALVARTGNAAPGTGPGVNFSGFGNGQVLNGAGATAFAGFLTGTGVDGTNNSGIWSSGGGPLALVARAGDVAPGTGINFSGFGVPDLNGAGATAFSANLTGLGSGIWSQGGGPLAVVVQSGNAAPGTAFGVSFDSFSAPSLNDAGAISFRGTLLGFGVNSSNDAGIWSTVSGSLGLVAREGNAAPGTGPGVNFSSLGGSVLNGAGVIAFSASLTGTGVNGTNDVGIWVADPSGLLHLIAREGDLFDVNDDPVVTDLRTISSVTLVLSSGGDDGRGSSLNDAGQLAFQLGFTDGSRGIFVATVAVPEPSTLLLLLAGGTAAVVAARRRTKNAPAEGTA